MAASAKVTPTLGGLRETVRMETTGAFALKPRFSPCFLVGIEGMRAIYIRFKGLHRVPHSPIPYKEPASFVGGQGVNKQAISTFEGIEV